jgi:hypothetical protein
VRWRKNTPLRGSDNGASGEGGPDGSLNENKMINGIPDDIQANLAMLDELGGTRTCNRTSPLGADGPGRSRYTHATPRPSRSSPPPS